MNFKQIGISAILLATVTTLGSTAGSAQRSKRQVSSPLAITTPNPLPTGTAGAPYNAQLTASGGSSPYSWAVTTCSGSCNTGLGAFQVPSTDPNFATTGTISGTPTGSGTSTFTFVVTDANGISASAALNITIAPPNSTTPPPSTPPPSTSSPLAITSTSLPSGTVSSSYNASLAATGGTTPYTWSIKGCSGVCDPNLTLSPNGAFSGTPTQSGSSTYNFGVTDANGQTASASLNLTIAAAAATSSGSAANYYVSPSGSDANPCTQSSPCATPDYVVNNKAAAGDVVQVAAGTYNYGGEVHFTGSGAAGKNITLTCATKWGCKIQNSVSGNSTVIEIDGSYFNFDGFEITNTSSAGNNIGIYALGSYLNITRNKIHHIEVDCSDVGGGGIITGAGSNHDITIDSNLIYDIGWPDGGSPRCSASTVQEDGIITETTGANMVFTNNIVYHVSGGWGIAPGSNGSGGPPVTVTNNLVFSNSNGGILIIGGGSGSTVANNIVLNNGLVAGQCGISALSGESITYANNDVWNNNGGSYCLDWGTSNQSVHSNDISVDPSLGTIFVNWQADGSGDYHEKAGSPTINNGSAIAGAPSNDFDGHPRPQGAGYDIGAYESTQ